MRKLLTFVVTFLTALFMMVNGVSALEKVDASINTNHKDIKSGEKVEITLKLDNFDGIKKGINAYKATLDYDEKIFEQVFQDAFACLNGWESLLYNPVNKEFVSINRVGVTKPEAVAKVTLKVKDGVKATKTSVKVKDIVLSEGKKDINVKNTSVNLNIIDEQISIPSDNDSNNSTSNSSSNNISSDVSTTVLGVAPKSNSALDKALKVSNDIAALEKQESSSEEVIASIVDSSDKAVKDKNDSAKNTKKIKKTTSNYFWLFLLLLAEILIVFIILYWRKKKKDDDNNNLNFTNKQKKFLFIFMVGMLSFEFVGTTYAAFTDFLQKGEVNGDNVVDYADVNLIELHLVDLKAIENKYLENADINSDGNITVTDLTLLIQKLEDSLDYEVTLSDLELDNYYPNKNEEIDLKFDAVVSYGSAIDKVVINGTEYSVTGIPMTDDYSVKVNTGKEAGVKEYKFTEAILNNGKKVKLDYTIKVDVLKKAPSVSNYVVTEDTSDKDNLKAIITFDFDDKDDSMTSGTIAVTDDQDMQVTSAKIKNGKNKLEVPVNDGETYKVEIFAKYDLDSNELKEEKDNSGALTLNKEICIVTDYNFNVNNLKTYKNDVETSIFEKLEKIELGFASTNNSKYEPATVKVNGKVYDVTKKNDMYVATIDGISDLGEKTITIEEVVLSNGKKFEVKKDNKVSLNIIKGKPIMGDFSTTENVSDSKLNVKFNFKDEDKAIKEAKVVLYDADGTEISSKKLSSDEINADEISKSLDTKITSKYNVKIIVIYNQTGDEEDDTEITLLNKEVNALPKAEITNVVTNKDYLEKGGVVTLTYTINSNKDNAISKIRVNNMDCIAEKISGDKYKVSYTVSDKAGITKLVTTKLIYDDKAEADVNKTAKVEVLKDIPVVENFTLEDDLENSVVNISFDFNDKENSLISAKAILTNTEDGTTVTKEIKKGKNELTFDVENSVKYTLDIKATYDRDTNSLEGSTEGDNLVLNKILFSKNVLQLSDYEVKITNLKTYNGDNESKYFEKNKPVIVTFGSTNLAELVPIKVAINGKWYDLTKDGDTYKTTTDSYDTAGVKTIVIEQVMFDNAKEVVLDGTDLVKIEVLKAKPTVNNFTYKEKEDGSVNVTFDLEDADKAYKSGKVILTDANDKEVKTVNVTEGKNEFSFMASSDSEYYNVKIVASYDLDTNKLGDSDNEFNNEVIATEIINVGDRLLEMKDIMGFVVYKQTSKGTEEVENLRESDLANLDNYIVKLQMKKMPTIYTKIKEYKVEDGKLKLTLDYDDIVQYNGASKQNKLEVVYGDMNDGTASNVSLESLIQKMTNNPGGTFTLTKDYDASTLTSSAATLLGTFTGTLNGNGHTIYNLSKPLFNSLEGATIENLKLDNVTLSGSSRGAITNTATNATITNVHVDGLTFVTGADRSGGIAGEVTSTNVERCSVKDLNLTTARIRIGGLIGQMNGGTIKNCYTDGTFTATSSKDGNGFGGIVGHAEKTPVTTIENCITKMSFKNASGHRLNGGIIGLPMNGTAVLKNNVSLATGEKVYRIHGSSIHSSSTNNYELEESTLTSNASGNRVKKVAKADINEDFFKNSVNFDSDIWDLSNASYDNVPVLKGSATTKTETVAPSNSSLYIPDYSRIKKINGYSESKDILYHNLYKLMPYYDAKYLIEDGEKVGNDDVLNTKIIKHILPYNSEGMVTYLTNNDYSKLTRLKVVFDDGTIKDYSLKFKELKQNVSIYEIDGLKVDYAYDNYVINENAGIVNTLTEYIKGLNYTDDLDPITAAADSRIYRDYFNETIKGNARNIALQLLQNDLNSSLSLDSNILGNKIKAELIDSGKLKQILYAYNYYHRWYDLEIGGAKVSDIMMFEGNMFSDSMTLDNLTNDVITGSFAPGSTWNFYGNKLAKYTPGKGDPGAFLDYIIKNIGGYEDVNDWFTENSSSIVYEIPAEGHPDVEYRAWRQLKRRGSYFLPFITLPQNAGYIVSSPTQFLVGSQRSYISDPSDPTQRQQLLNTIKSYSKLISNFYSTTAGFVEASILNSYTDIQVDYRYIVGGGYQNPGTTEDAFHKNFNEAVNYWAAANGAAAYATGSNVYWVAYRALNTGSFPTWSHETGHNQDSKIFLKGGGRRGSAEEYADGNTSQGAGDGGVNFNLAYEWNMNQLTTVNLTPERINSTEKIESYYRRMYEVWDFLDYAYAKAFLKLTPEEQAKVAVQVGYPNNNANNTSWTVKTADDFKAMNLKTVEDLWDNQIVIKPGVTSVTTRPGGGKYGYESIYPTRWYQPHNDAGRGDCYTFKLLAWEMLGVGGYDGGYATYYSKRSANDLDAIRKVTGDETMTWKKYKMGRYDLMEEKWGNLPYVSSEEIYNEFLENLKLDAGNNDRNATASMNVKRRMYHFLKRVTNDFRSEVFTNNVEVIHIKSAEQFQNEITAKPYGNFVLDNDIDVSGLTGTNAIIDGTFYGKLDGNGHKIIGNTMPLFQKIRFGYVDNLKFDDTHIVTRTSGLAAALTSAAEYATITNITSTNTEVELNGVVRDGVSAMVAAQSSSYVNNIDVSIKIRNINSVEDFLKIAEAPGKVYQVTSDIDFSGYTGDGTSVINVAFGGKIEGNGHTIKNLNGYSLFSNFNGTVENLNIKNFTNIKTGDEVAAFAKFSSRATFRNMSFENIRLEGRHRVAPVVTFDNSNSTFERISVINANVKGSGVYVSTFIGRKYGGTIKNVYVNGSIECTTTENGGLIGALQKGGTIENVVTNVSVNKPSNTDGQNRQLNAGFIGNIYTDGGTLSIKNSISVSSMKGYTDNAGNEMKPYKFTGASEGIINGYLVNCYEYEDADGTSSVSENTSGHLESASKANVYDRRFYIDRLSFDERYWDFDDLDQTGYPKLKVDGNVEVLTLD